MDTSGIEKLEKYERSLLSREVTSEQLEQDLISKALHNNDSEREPLSKDAPFPAHNDASTHA